MGNGTATKNHRPYRGCEACSSEVDTNAAKYAGRKQRRAAVTSHHLKPDNEDKPNCATNECYGKYPPRQRRFALGCTLQ